MPDDIAIPILHPVFNVALRAAYWLLLDVEVQGLENVPRTGPFIIAINHNSFLDPLIPIVYLRSDILPMAKVEVFQGIFAPIFWGYGAYPVRRGEADLNALKYSLRVLRAGHPMLISPEGTRSKTGELKEPHEGAAVIATRSGAPILPVAMWGGKLFWSNLKRVRRTKIHSRVGKPLKVQNLNGKPSRQVLRAITDELMYYLAAMLPPEMRGIYADVGDFKPHYLLPEAASETARGVARNKEVMPVTE